MQILVFIAYGQHLNVQTDDPGKKQTKHFNSINRLWCAVIQQYCFLRSRKFIRGQYYRSLHGLHQIAQKSGRPVLRVVGKLLAGIYNQKICINTFMNQFG